MLKQTLNKGISTPIAIGVIAVLVILVGGFTWWQYGEIRKEETELPEIELPEKEVDETTDWKTYVNDKLGYEVKYPKDWYFLKDACCPPSPTSVNLNNYSDKKGEFAQHQLEEGIFGFDILCIYKGNLDEVGEVKLLKEEGTQYEYLKVNKAEAIRFTKDSTLTHYIKKNDSVCRIIFSKKCITCNKILSTFRFVEEDETAGWKAYTETNYLGNKCSIEYPDSWEIKHEDLINVTYLSPKEKRIPEDIWVTISCFPKEKGYINQNTGKDLLPLCQTGKFSLVYTEKFEAVHSKQFCTLSADGSQIGTAMFQVRGGRQRMDYYISDDEFESEFDTFSQMLSTFRFIDISACSSIEVDGYSYKKEIKEDLNKDGQEETIIVYKEKAEDLGSKLIIVKIFSGTEDCPNEKFSYQGKGNEIWKTQTFSNFWGDGANAVMVEDVNYAGGSGSTGHLTFFTYRDGEYSAIKGPQLSGHNWQCCKFNGDNGIGKKIIAAESRWADDYSDYCAGCKSRFQFFIYTWNGKEYIKTEAGITENKYSGNIEEILKKEPSVINSQ